MAAPEAPAGAAAVLPHCKKTGFQGESLTLLAVGKASKLGLGGGALGSCPCGFLRSEFLHSVGTRAQGRFSRDKGIKVVRLLLLF